ncbi:MAG TPA: hypothetical protein VGB53_12970 [Rubricoccaceae bacterium]|jgi:hypothetical protein
MDDSTPLDPSVPQTPPVAMPNPHSNEAVPASESGMRPEAAANAEVRPEQDEPGGPLGGLVGTAATQASSEAAPGNVDTALLESMGVEGEGIESSQILGLVAGVVFAVIGLGVVLVCLFYLPYLQQTGNRASDVSDYPELEQSRTEARAKLGQYARQDSLYHVPIEQAMSVVAGRYAAAEAGAQAPAGLPATRQQWNTLMLNRGTGTAVQNPAGLARRTTVEQERLAAESEGEAGASRGTAPAGARPPNAPALVPRTPGQTNEAVGTDDVPTQGPLPTTLGDAQHDG